MRVLPASLALSLSLPLLGLLPLSAGAAEAAQDLTITSVEVDTTVVPRSPESGGDIRQQAHCSVRVTLDDAAVRDPGRDGYYELRTPGTEFGIARTYLYEDDPTTVSTFGCWMFTPDEPTQLSVHYVEFDEEAGEFGDYVDLASSEPVDFTLREVGHPSGARIEGPGVSEDAVTVGSDAVITFDGSWPEDAGLTAKVTTTQGWRSLAAQDAAEREIPTTYDPTTQTFTFTPDASLAGRTVYVTVKAAAPGGGAADYAFTWSPKLLVDADAPATKRSWVETFGRVDKKKSAFFLRTTKAVATRAGEKAGVRFAYQGWFGEERFFSWHSSARSVAVGEFGGCPTVVQQVRVLAFVPGRLPVTRTITMQPSGCRGVPGGVGAASATGAGSWG